MLLLLCTNLQILPLSPWSQIYYTSFSNMYYPLMKLVLEQASNNTFKFVEGKNSVADEILSCTWQLIFWIHSLLQANLNSQQLKIISPMLVTKRRL